MQEFTWWTEVSLTPLAPVCFCAGTMIKTIRGEVAIENLRVDDMVLTMDAGYQPIRWIGSRKLSSSLLNSFPKLRPIRILAGAMGQNMPERDLLVSRQHRMLVKSRISERMFESPEVLIPAIKLCAMPGIYVDVEVEEVEYFHMLFDTHQVVYANGSPSESLYTGTEALKALSPEAREEITTLFPEICAPDFVPTAAREIPSGKRQKKLLERHLKSAKHQLIA
ncbi:Hint domain-containing protein [Shimia sp. R11_0]|nr:Hint domain-containing protein [Shimia sp. R11_0]